jgi:hypothetical protein
MRVNPLPDSNYADYQIGPRKKDDICRKKDDFDDVSPILISKTGSDNAS